MNMLKRNIYYNRASNKVSSQSLDMFHVSHGSLFLVCLGVFLVGWVFVWGFLLVGCLVFFFVTFGVFFNVLFFFFLT